MVNHLSFVWRQCLVYYVVSSQNIIFVRLNQHNMDFHNRLKLPLIAAPMFLVSGVELVKEACNAGIIGSFPMTNARTIEDLRSWFMYLKNELHEDAAPFAANMIVHTTYSRFEEERALIEEFQPSIVITALGSPSRIVETVHNYGGKVFADVNSIPFARKAAATGVDGLVCVANGAGGHTGFLNPFVFVNAVREFFNGTVILAGGMSTGRDVLAARAAGADLCYMGTRFIAVKESLAQEAYKEMIVNSTSEDIILTDQMTGVPANFIRQSLEQAGIVVEGPGKAPDFSKMNQQEGGSKAWKDIWSAGQCVNNIQSVVSVKELVEQLINEYETAKTELKNNVL